MKMIITTGNTFDGYVVDEYIGICTGRGYGYGFSASPKQVDEQMKAAETEAINNLEANASKLGANTILGIDVKLFTASKIPAIMAYGTAVKVSKL